MYNGPTPYPVDSVDGFYDAPQCGYLQGRSAALSTLSELL
jgi:hypothetical protein